MASCGGPGDWDDDDYDKSTHRRSHYTSSVVSYSAYCPSGLSPHDKHLIAKLKMDMKPKKKTVYCVYCETARDLNENYSCLHCGASSFREE